MDIEFAESRAGHDKNRIYLVVKQDENHVWLVNGTTRLCAAPKKKSRKHVQLIRKLPAEVKECLSGPENDVTIKRALKIYQKSRNQKQEDL